MLFVIAQGTTTAMEIFVHAIQRARSLFHNVVFKEITLNVYTLVYSILVIFIKYRSRRLKPTKINKQTNKIKRPLF